MIRLSPRPLDESGTFTVLGLMLFVGLIIPIFVLVSNLATITNASSQAHGLAYNLAFAGVNRGVDGVQTRQSGAIVMLRESLDGVNPAVAPDAEGNGTTGPSKVAKLGAAYGEMNAVAQKMQQAAGLSGGSSRSTMSIVGAPNTAQTTGFADGHSTFAFRPMSLYSVAFDPIDAAFFTRLLNGGNDCDVEAGQVVGNPLFATCWVDSRESLVSDEVRAQYEAAQEAGPPIDRAAYVTPSAWGHYTSGAEVQVEVRSRLWFGGEWLDRKIGVAAFGRPCDTNRGSDIFGTGAAAGSHCQY